MVYIFENLIFERKVSWIKTTTKDSHYGNNVAKENYVHYASTPAFIKEISSPISELLFTGGCPGNNDDPGAIDTAFIHFAYNALIMSVVVMLFVLWAISRSNKAPSAPK